jgi:DHA1 family tetracycline resistance protein-like MFS transporter
MAKQHTRAGTSDQGDGSIGPVLLILALSVGLMMVGYGIVAPVFARRFDDLGAGVGALSLLMAAAAAGQFLFAPLMGSLADRYGRRPLILIGLAAIVVANTVYLFIDSTGSYIVVRFVLGVLSAGILPAALGTVADLVPEDRRAQSVGIVMGSYGVGFVVGPTIGGVLFDAWGFAAPFAASALLGVITFVIAATRLPETRRTTTPAPSAAPQRREPWREALPRPLALLGALLALDLLAILPFALVEPPMLFYFYDNLGFSATQFGLVVGAYGLTQAIGQVTLGRLSDRWGRAPLIALGFALNIVFYGGMGFAGGFGSMALVAAVGGLGTAFITPALSAAYLDITAPQHRARVMGLKESMAALSGVVGPLASAMISGAFAPQQIFVMAAGLAVLATLVALGVQVTAGRPACAECPPLVRAGS